MEENKKGKISWWLVFAFSIIPIGASLFSMIQVIEFFGLTHSYITSIGLAIIFEAGALTALAGLIAIEKINKNTIWFLFIILSAYQMLGNSYSAFQFLTERIKEVPTWLQSWTEFLNIEEFELPFVKRTLAIASGAIIPIISLGFLHMLMNYVLKTLGLKEIKQKKIVPELKPEPIAEEIVESKASEITMPWTGATIGILPSEDYKITPEEYFQNTQNKDFESYTSEVKKRLDTMREPYMEMLNIMYENGKYGKEDQLPDYTEFISKIELNEYLQKIIEVKQRDINLFLTLCNYLEILRVSGTQRISLKTYEEAKETLNNYLTLGEGK